MDNRKERLKEIISKKRLYSAQKQNQNAQQDHKILESKEVSRKSAEGATSKETAQIQI